VGDCHGQSLLAVEQCLGVQNNTWIAEVLKDDYTLKYCFSVLRELLTELNCGCWSICVTTKIHHEHNLRLSQ
jgi:malate synthase